MNATAGRERIGVEFESLAGKGQGKDLNYWQKQDWAGI